MTETEEETVGPDVVERSIQQANQFHAMMDQAKAWSREAAGELRVKAALEDDEETASEIEQAASMVKTVTQRIEQGDNNRARNFDQ